MSTPHYEHPILVAVFLGIFTIFCLIGIYKLARQRRIFGVAVLFVSALVFGYSTYIAATLHLT